MSTTHKNLRLALKANALFSLSTGLSLLLFSKPIARLMYLEQSMILLLIGIGLLLFVITLARLAFAKSIKAREVKTIIYLDWAWVIGSVVLLVWQPIPFSVLGSIMIGIAAFMVMVLAIAQARSLA